MKNLSIGLIALATMCMTACNNSGKENIEKADSANKAKMDNPEASQVVTDEKSSAFLVRVANAGMSEVELTKLAESKAVTPEIKKFANMLWNDHTQLNAQVKQMAADRNITLPDSTSSDHRKLMDDMKAKTGKNFDKDFIQTLIKNHNNSIDMFEKAVNDVNDNAVRTFADNTLPKLRMHRDSAQAIEKKYW